MKFPDTVRRDGSVFIVGSLQRFIFTLLLYKPRINNLDRLGFVYLQIAPAKTRDFVLSSPAQCFPQCFDVQISCEDVADLQLLRAGGKEPLTRSCSQPRNAIAPQQTVRSDHCAPPELSMLSLN